MRRHPTGHEERSFGYAVGVVCLALAWYLAWRGRGLPARCVGGVGAMLVALAALRPMRLRFPRAAWERLAQALGWVNSRVVLSALFVLAITPMAFVLRRTTWDPLRIRQRPPRSGWVPSPERHRDPRHYERMY